MTDICHEWLDLMSSINRTIHTNQTTLVANLGVNKLVLRYRAVRSEQVQPNLVVTLPRLCCFVRLSGQFLTSSDNVFSFIQFE